MILHSLARLYRLFAAHFPTLVGSLRYVFEHHSSFGYLLIIASHEHRISCDEKKMFSLDGKFRETSMWNHVAAVKNVLILQLTEKLAARKIEWNICHHKFFMTLSKIESAIDEKWQNHAKVVTCCHIKLISQAASNLKRLHLSSPARKLCCSLYDNDNIFSMHVRSAKVKVPKVQIKRALEDGKFSIRKLLKLAPRSLIITIKCQTIKFLIKFRL